MASWAGGGDAGETRNGLFPLSTGGVSHHPELKFRSSGLRSFWLHKGRSSAAASATGGRDLPAIDFFGMNRFALTTPSTAMSKPDPRIDDYINEASEFARPILRHVRKLVRSANPDIAETTKWGMPYFDYRGPLCGMAAFKHHCALTFWRDIPLDDLIPARESAMGQFGQIKSLADLPADDVLLACVRRAVAHREAPRKEARPAAAKTARPVTLPKELQEVLAAAPNAARHFKEFSPSQQREYAEWIAEAKQAATRERRLATALEWIAEGKSRHWKYQK
jgi:uncharacterized protein YdeI (YjbR/CyaY-like superfamily)